MASEEDVASFLHQDPSQPFTAITRLSGGFTNWTWDVKVPEIKWKAHRDAECPEYPSPAQERNSIIVKHARGHSATMPGLSLAVNRQAVEYSALVQGNRFVHGGQHESGNEMDVVLPEVLRYDPETHLIAMTSGGSRTLKDAFASLDKITVSKIGSRLRQWVEKLHGGSINCPIDVDTKLGGNPLAKDIYRYSYRNLPSALQKWQLDSPVNLALASRVDDQYGALISTFSSQQRVLCHGDFWPGNIIVSEPIHEDSTLTVVDWEITRRDINGATDTAQFLAEATLLDYLRGSKGLVSAFFGATVEKMRWIKQGEDEAFVAENRRLLAHWGVHVAFWPSAVPAWSDDDPEKLVRLAECGIDAIKRALDGTQEQVCRGLVHIIWIATGMIQDCKLMAED